MVRYKRIALPFMIAAALQSTGCDYFVDAEDRLERANEELAGGNDRAALIELQNAVRIKPELTDARLQLVELSLRMGDARSAERELAAAVEHGAVGERVEVLSAEVKLQLSHPDELLKLLDSGALKLEEPMHSSFRGLALLRTDRVQDAISVLQGVAGDPKASRARVGLAEALMRDANSARAAEVLRNELTTNPDNAAALFLHGNLLLRQGEYKTAADTLSQARRHSAAQMNPLQQAALLLSLTEAWLGAGDVERAREVHTELTARAPEAPFTRVLAARIAMARHDYSTAVSEAQKVVVAAPDMLQAKLLLGIALAAQGNLNQAEAQLADLVQRAPENVEARKLLARVNLQLRRPDAAMSALEPLRASADEDSQLAALVGATNLQKGERVAGIAMLERSVALEPDNSDLKFDLVAAYAASGQNDLALKLLGSLPESDPRREAMMIPVTAAAQGPAAARKHIDAMVSKHSADPAMLVRGAWFYAQLRDFDKATATIQQALRLEPSNASTLVTLARIHSAAGATVEAAQAAQKAVAVDPSNEAARVVAAELLARSGDLPAAIEHLEAVRSKRPTAVEPRLLLVRAYLRQQDMARADAVLREVEQQASANAAAADSVGQVYLETGRFDQALRWFREAARLDAGNPVRAFNVARAQVARGDDVLARETLRKLLTQHNDFFPAIAELIFLDARGGRYDLAFKELEQRQSGKPDDPRFAILEGDLALGSKTYDRAVAAYSRAFRQQPSSDLAIKMYRARLEAKLPDPTEPLRGWLSQRGGDSAVRLVLAEHHTRAGQAEKAIAEYETVASSGPVNPYALNNLAWLYYQKGDKRAIETAKRAYESAPGIPAVADTYGWILVESGDLKTGLPVLEKAAGAAKEPEIRFHYAAALARAGQTDTARTQLRELVRTNGQFPSAPDAKKLLAELGG